MSPKFPHGFKTKAEAASHSIRQQLRLTVDQACPARLVAGIHKITVTSAGALNGDIMSALGNEFPNQMRARKQLALVSQAAHDFSAIVAIVGGFKMILYNGNNSPARQESDIMHEIAHVLCGHKGDCLQLNADISLRVHNEAHEQEAKWLGATLQIPADGILKHVLADRTSAEIAEIYGASLPMVTYRRRTLATDRHADAIRRKRQ